MSGVLGHSWALSPLATQGPGVTMGPLLPMVLRAIMMERCTTNKQFVFCLHWAL